MPWWGKKKDTHSGFIDDMSDEQAEALYELKELIEQNEVTQDPRFTDEYLLRFLRFHNFNVEKTLTMFTNFLEWREEMKVDQAIVLYQFPELPQLKKLYEHGYHQTDYEGRPVWVDRPWAADINAWNDIATPDLMTKYYVAEYEKLLHCKLPACSAAAGKTIETTFCIVDCKGFSMSLMNKKGREFLKIASTLGENYYPEIMWQMYVINTPLMFKAAWAAIKPFINEKSRKKIKILGTKYQKDLFQIVDPDNLPAAIGGNCTWEDKGGNCFIASPGPWDIYPGDEFGEAAMKQLEDIEPENVVVQEEANFEEYGKIGSKLVQMRPAEDDFTGSEEDFDTVTETN